MPSFTFDEVARLPDENDNAAIATRTLQAGSEIVFSEQILTLDHTVLEGHRFATRYIAKDEYLTSWGSAFGVALKDISPGNYLVNKGVLNELGGRSLNFGLPQDPNFSDQLDLYTLDEQNFQPALSLPRYNADELDKTPVFQGFTRPGGRGVGTRNYIVLLGTSGLGAGFVRQLEAQLKNVAEGYKNITGIVAVAHTEGAHGNPNNKELVLRTLAGFFTHPNVGAILAVDYGHEAITNADLASYMREKRYPLDGVPHSFLTLNQGIQAGFTEASAIVTAWLPQVNATPRTPTPLVHLKIALQCGGSDAFSGVSGNPLAAWVTKEIIKHGGSANLAETDELIGAEAYMLQKVRDLATAKRFLETLQRFQDWAGQYRSSAHGNPSGGNKFRGLYNIYLKSLGAAAKRHPDVPLDGVLDYATTMTAPGFFFMDSPGNDLESITGQVASGCNLIYFVTGNGSITNFPFVPTIKITTTTARHLLLSQEMDVNAGEYLDGTPLDVLGAKTFDLTLAVSSGAQTAGEKAGHAQVQIWRDWPHRIDKQIAQPTANRTWKVTRRRAVEPTVGLILPTSLCSSQIARFAAEKLNRSDLIGSSGLSRFVALPHTEGCGCSDQAAELFQDILLNYVRHPMVRHTLLLEHGCEKTHNDAMRHRLVELGIDPETLGWASVQMDGGIQAVFKKIENWFRETISRSATPSSPERLSFQRDFPATLGLFTIGPLPDETANKLAQLVNDLEREDTSIIIPANDLLLLATPLPMQPNLPFAGHPPSPGLYIMDNPTRGWSEALTGLGAAGAEIILVHSGDISRPGHPLVPVLQIASNPQIRSPEDFDLVLGKKETIIEPHQEIKPETGRLDPGRLFKRHTQQSPASQGDPILNLLRATLSGKHIPRAQIYGLYDFQITRGRIGITL